MRVHKGDRGLGLIEALIAAALALLLLSLLHRFLVPVMHTNAQTSVKIHLRQQGTVSMEKLAQDLRASSSHTVSYVPPDGSPSTRPVVLAFTKLESVTASGRPVYEPKVTLYVWTPADKKLHRKVWPPAPPALPHIPSPSRPLVLSQDELLSIAAEHNGSERLLASDVVDFQPLESWPMVAPLKASLHLQKDVPGKQDPAELKLERTVSFRN